jgi:hypothetical protein
MAFDVINVGTAVNDGTGDTLRSGGQKINANFAIAVEKTADDGAALLPVGDDAERPTPAVGMLRFNTDSGGFEGYDGSAWGAIGGAPAPAGFLFAGTEVYATTGSFAKADPLGTGDIGLAAIRVRVVGGGGGGGGANTTSSSQASVAGGGGGAAYAESFITNIAGLSSTETVTVAAGGTAGAAAGGNGGAGGNSSFGSLVTANGGLGGQGSAASGAPAISTRPGNPMSTATGDLVVPGSAGFAGFATAATGARSAGGHTLLGHGGSPDYTTGGLDGSVGTGYGSGGSGGVNTQNQATARAGGAGAPGIVIVECFV